jgi:hypothetical protein
MIIMYIDMKKSLPCTSRYPMYCNGEGLARLFKESKSQFPSQTLINSSQLQIVDGANWSFDPERMIIWNNRYWKGFYPADYDFKDIILMYGFGFYKRFWPDKDEKEAAARKVMGETHPFNTSIHAANEAVDMDLPDEGRSVYIKYRDFPFKNFDDVLKIIDRDTVLGKAYVSVRIPGKGIPIFHFVLSRRYSLDFMTQADCRFIHKFKSQKVEIQEVLGTWDLLLVSNAALSPPILRVKFRRQGSDLKIDLVKLGNLPVGSQIEALDEKLAKALGLPGKLQNGSVRAAGRDFLVGVLDSPHDPVLDALRGSKGFITEDQDGLYLPYTLKRLD